MKTIKPDISFDFKWHILRVRFALSTLNAAFFDIKRVRAMHNSNHFTFNEFYHCHLKTLSTAETSHFQRRCRAKYFHFKWVWSDMAFWRLAAYFALMRISLNPMVFQQSFAHNFELIALRYRFDANMVDVLSAPVRFGYEYIKYKMYTMFVYIAATLRCSHRRSNSHSTFNINIWPTLSLYLDPFHSVHTLKVSIASMLQHPRII